MKFPKNKTKIKSHSLKLSAGDGASCWSAPSFPAIRQPRRPPCSSDTAQQVGFPPRQGPDYSRACQPAQPTAVTCSLYTRPLPTKGSDSFGRAGRIHSPAHSCGRTLPTRPVYRDAGSFLRSRRAPSLRRPAECYRLPFQCLANSVSQDPPRHGPLPRALWGESSLGKLKHKKKTPNTTEHPPHVSQ